MKQSKMGKFVEMASYARINIIPGGDAQKALEAYKVMSKLWSKLTKKQKSRLSAKYPWLQEVSAQLETAARPVVSAPMGEVIDAKAQVTNPGEDWHKTMERYSEARAEDADNAQERIEYEAEAGAHRLSARSSAKPRLQKGWLSAAEKQTNRIRARHPGMELPYDDLYCNPPRAFKCRSCGLKYPMTFRSIDPEAHGVCKWCSGEERQEPIGFEGNPGAAWHEAQYEIARSGLPEIIAHRTWQQHGRSGEALAHKLSMYQSEADGLPNP
jgi:hypothetical protein